jgi:hypothetical protein
MRKPLHYAPAATSLIALALLGCTGKPEGSAARVSVVTRQTPIEFSFPPGWYENSQDHPFDLQCFAPFERMNTGVFAYQKIDLAADSTPLDVFWEQVNDLKSKRRNVRELEPLQKQELADKTITFVAFLGDKDSSRNAYRYSLIEFKGDDSRFAVALQVALPSDWKDSKPVLEEIIQSARPLPNRE